MLEREPTPSDKCRHEKHQFIPFGGLPLQTHGLRRSIDDDQRAVPGAARSDERRRTPPPRPARRIDASAVAGSSATSRPPEVCGSYSSCEHLGPVPAIHHGPRPEVLPVGAPAAGDVAVRELEHPVQERHRAALESGSCSRSRPPSPTRGRAGRTRSRRCSRARRRPARPPAPRSRRGSASSSTAIASATSDSGARSNFSAVAGDAGAERLGQESTSPGLRAGVRPDARRARPRR